MATRESTSALSLQGPHPRSVGVRSVWSVVSDASSGCPGHAPDRVLPVPGLLPGPSMRSGCDSHQGRPWTAPWTTRKGPSRRKGLNMCSDLLFLRADDRIRTGDPNLGKVAKILARAG